MPSEILSERKVQGGSLIPVIVANDESDSIPVEVVTPILLENFVSLVNVTHGPLNPGEAFIGGSEDILVYTTIVVTMFANEDSATSGLEFQFSNDNLIWWTSDEYSYFANSRKTYTIQRQAQFFRVIYTNGSILVTEIDLHCIYNSTAGVHSSHRIGDTISDEDDAILNKAVLSGQQPIGTQINIKATAEGELKTSVVTPVGVLPVSQLTTLHDGKILNRLFPEISEIVGTGTGTFQTNKYNMNVTAGQWLVYISRRFSPYFSGKPQKVELTFDTFQPEVNVIKRVGYFSSNTASPYGSDYDGFYLESGGGTISFVMKNDGVDTFNIDITNWDSFAAMGDYQNVANWENFTVVEFNFLWLGGAYIELRLVTDRGFLTVHKFIYAGTLPDVFMQFPNQPVRYEIRSTTGTGDFRYICNQVATSGSVDESTSSKSIDTGFASITLGTIGTTYPLISIRKKVTNRENLVKLTDADLFIESNDRARWQLEINPTLSAALTYNAVSDSSTEFAIGDGAITVTSPGTVIASGYISQRESISPDLFTTNYMSFLSGSIDGTQDEFILSVTPITSNLSAFGSISIGEG